MDWRYSTLHFCLFSPCLTSPYLKYWYRSSTTVLHLHSPCGDLFPFVPGDLCGPRCRLLRKDRTERRPEREEGRHLLWQRARVRSENNEEGPMPMLPKMGIEDMSTESQLWS